MLILKIPIISHNPRPILESNAKLSTFSLTRIIKVLKTVLKATEHKDLKYCLIS